MGNRFQYGMSAALAIRRLNEFDDDALAAVAAASESAEAAAASAAEVQEALHTINLDTTISIGGPEDAESLKILAPIAPASGAHGRIEVQGGDGAAATWPRVYPSGTPADLWMNIGSKGASGIRLWAGLPGNGSEVMRIANVGATVNRWEFTGGGAGTSVVATVNGADTNAGIQMRSKGMSNIRFMSHGNSATEMVRMIATTSATNYLGLTPAITGQRVRISADGTVDANRGIVLAAAGNEGIVHESNGTVVTYSSNPASAVSYISFQGNTTGQRVTIAAQSNEASTGMNLQAKGPSGAVGVVANGAEQVRVSPHSGTSNSALGLRGGTTSTRAAIFPVQTGATTALGLTLNALGTEGVETVSNNATALYVSNPSTSVVNYFWLRGAPTGVSPTFRTTGTDPNVPMTFNVLGAADFAFTSDGDSFTRQFKIGRVASANRNLAVQGSNGGRVTMYTEGAGADRGIQLIAAGAEGIEFASNNATAAFISNPAAGATDYINIAGANTAGGGRPIVGVAGPTSTIPLGLVSKDSSIQFFTRQDHSVRGFNVAHTASGQNYLQVASATAGLPPVITSQGPDTDIGMYTNTKGLGVHVWAVGNTEVMRIGAAGAISVANNTVNIVTPAGHLRLRSYTVATLPSAAQAQELIYVANGTSNKRLAVSDGINWRWPDGAIIS